MSHNNYKSLPVDSLTAPAKGLPQGVLSFSGEVTPYPREATVATLFEEIVAKYPSKVALISDGAILTYRELNQQSNCLAHLLREAGVKAESLVGVCLNRSSSLVVALLAVLKAGGAFVPLDPAYPSERLKFLLDDTRTSLVITDANLAGVVPVKEDVALLLINSDGTGLIDGVEDQSPARESDARSLAYVMYTSGSTGKPKGVMVENRSIVRLVRNNNYCEFGTEEVILQSAPIPFDASTFEIWGALLNGGTVVMAPSTASLEDLGKTIREHGVTTAFLTTSLFNLFVEERLEDLLLLRQIITGGEVGSARHFRRVLDHFEGGKLIHAYGPTENTTFTTCHVMRQGYAVPDAVPIGRPLSNTFVYILDEQLQPVAVGVTGELFTGGDGVARGYLNSRELTAEKFIQDPWSPYPDARMYRTGDLARWLEDGTIEFVGRIDDQVKILGHRIEPGEIEAAIAQFAGVARVTVLANVDATGSKSLVAYFVPKAGEEVRTNALKDFLEAKLPPYMVPANYISLPSFPLTAHGKLDRRALPTPQPVSGDASRESSRTELEETIAGVWKGVLSLEHVGTDDNFFDLGGNSLKLMAAHSQLQKAMNRSFPVVMLFEFTTIRQLADRLARTQEAAPIMAGVQSQGQKQRDAFARRKASKGAR